MMTRKKSLVMSTATVAAAALVTAILSITENLAGHFLALMVAIQESLAHQEHLEAQDLQDLLANREIPEYQEHQEHRALMERQDKMAKMERREHQEHQEHQVLMELQELQAKMAKMEHQELQDHLDQQDLQDLQDRGDLQASSIT